MKTEEDIAKRIDKLNKWISQTEDIQKEKYWLNEVEALEWILES